MIMEKLTTLSELLQSPDDFPWNEAIYLPKDQDWSLSSPVALSSSDDCVEGEDPIIARNNGLAYALMMSDGQDIVANARAQKPDSTLDDLLKAFVFYYKNDAFITFK
jgi:hypothetical protein